MISDRTIGITFKGVRSGSKPVLFFSAMANSKIYYTIYVNIKPHAQNFVESCCYLLQNILLKVHPDMYINIWTYTIVRYKSNVSMYLILWCDAFFNGMDQTGFSLIWLPLWKLLWKHCGKGRISFSSTYNIILI